MDTSFLSAVGFNMSMIYPELTVVNGCERGSLPGQYYWRATNCIYLDCASYAEYYNEIQPICNGDSFAVPLYFYKLGLT